MFNLLSKILVFAIACIGFSGCNEVIEERFYVPCNYHGWINIIYEAKGNSYSISTDKVNVYMLSGDLTRCLVKNKAHQGGFTTKLFYTCADTLEEIPTFNSVNSHVSQAYSSQIKIDGSWHPMYSFYLSGNRLERNLPDKALPPNPVDTIHYQSP